MAFESSHGITFTFAGDPYTATSVAVSRGRQDFDISSTDLADGSLRRIRAGGLTTMEIKVDWIGKTVPPTDTLYEIAVEGDSSPTDGEATPMAMCTGLSVTASVGDLVKGTAVFKVSCD